ncbi:MAG: hypothetical protein A3H98_07680 [Bacteroidetes bacterium RIFCSPLOWO2_02_FULL_36_8]|nr:MAG: hypothetical protein A3H98_07680 [Bacteroidetes bacterium RIFCSPLOWO2_02_FULL_36_8]OFY71985.1 MAG: hypothetical protein A3G23_00120 [Bacteroidetes bacterium RIFCSPLOWO2_12_FULL_37_12]
MISKCDTLKNYIDKNESILKPQFYNLDPENKIYTVKKGNESSRFYEFKFSKIDPFTKYILSLDGITFPFNINSTYCELSDDTVICYVDELKLSKECSNKALGKGSVGLDCIYGRYWSIKVCGNICDTFNGPFSDEIKGISLQCFPPDISR